MYSASSDDSSQSREAVVGEGGLSLLGEGISLLNRESVCKQTQDNEGKLFAGQKHRD